MDSSLRRAKALLQDGYTCVFCRDDSILTDRRRGIRPLLELIDRGLDLRDYCVADKVVGKAAALLYCRMGIRRVYAPVASHPAAEILSRQGIELTCENLVPAIRNRANTDLCPMEKAVQSITEPEEAICAIRAALESLQK